MGDGVIEDGKVALAAVLFTDIVGSTELLVRAGDSSADRTRTANERLTAAAIERRGGHLVKNLGDGCMAVFPSASAAIEAAVEMQQESDRWGRSSENEAFRLRIGISIGDVIADGGDYYGVTVVEARRLEEAAPPGRIWATAACTALARELDHSVEIVGSTRMKGLPDPVDVVAVDWTPIPDARQIDSPDLPPVVGRGGGLPFAGRTDVLARLHDAWDRAATAGQVVLLAGEPGIGKTRTASEFARSLATPGVRVLAGRCDEELAVAFRPVAEALGWYAEHASSDTLRVGIGRHGGELRRLVPELATWIDDLSAAPDADDATRRLRLLQACESWLADDEPTVLVLDDLQWADPDTVLLVRHLATAARRDLLIVCTYRDTDVDHRHRLTPALADLRRLDNVSRVDLGGLDATEVRELLTRASGHRLDDEGRKFADRLGDRTSGNPFFLGELLRHFAEDGTLVQRDGTWSNGTELDAVGVPAGVHDVVVRRLARLPDSCRPILLAAAVVGHEFDVSLVAAIEDQPSDAVLDALEVAADANLVTESGNDRFQFAHGLVRDALYHGLSASRRSRMHRHAARVLEARHVDDLDAVAIELATHWTAAGVADDLERAVESAIVAAEHSVERGGTESAIAWYRKAVDLAFDSPGLAPVRRRAMLGAAVSERIAGDPAHRETARRAAEEAMDAGDPAVTRSALLVHGRFGYSVEQQADPAKVELLRRAVAQLEFRPPHRVEVLGMLATELVFVDEMDDRQRLLAEIDRLLPDIDPMTRGALLANSAIWRFSGYDRSVYAERARLISQALDAQSDSPTRGADRSWETEAKYFLTYLACFLGDRDAIDTGFARLRSATESSVDPIHVMWTEVLDTMIATLDGRIDDAVEGTRQYSETMRRAGAPEGMAWTGLGLFATGREQGRLDGLLRGFVTFAEHSPPGGPTVASVAFLHMASGDHDAARALLDAVAVDQIADDGALGFTMPMFCEVASVVGTSEQCGQLLDRFAPWATMHVVCGPIYAGAVDRIFARLHDRRGEQDLADDLFASAVRQHELMRSPPWVARTHLDWAESLLARGADGVEDHVDAAEAAIDGLDLAESRGRVSAFRSRINDG